MLIFADSKRAVEYNRVIYLIPDIMILELVVLTSSYERVRLGRDCQQQAAYCCYKQENRVDLLL